ncbi:F0F1 ATP synthase subunit B [Halobacillus litoralis]|uniref:ATP synthase subunit b n=1 Tax=Halobacillus litoralis TaxID=45668 RepID=A0A845E1T0_9BACI|nr:F0F1 ATP synthase subunit B [Halobacillus litoralis]MYL29341.1 F0F1 ATP synthase subunit B [Halobacillus halophilus]MYL36558.1 F0F1 ATP synthase subunit B [Halobacillus litoralis]
MQGFAANLVLGAEGGLLIGDMIVQLVFFLGLLALLGKFAWGPLMKMMKDREDYVANEINTAEKSREEAHRMQREASDELKATRQDAQKIIEDARKTAGEQERDILDSARAEAERLKESARQEIEQEKEKAVQALKDQVAGMSVMIASKVIEKELSEKDQEALINQYINEAGEKR